MTKDKIKSEENLFRKQKASPKTQGEAKYNIDFHRWSNNFHSSSRFWKSKGNVDTRSKLKDEWYKEFFDMLKETKRKRDEWWIKKFWEVWTYVVENYSHLSLIDQKDKFEEELMKLKQEAEK